MIKSENKIIQRPPIVAIMGHIDHGKSTLLSYIRKNETGLDEAGGITQHISAYEVVHNGEKITFLDTPGHEAFSGHRSRGAHVADLAVLVVSAEDGVKPQTIETLSSIKKNSIPFVVAISKIDKTEANIERTKQSLAENEIFVEGYGGEIPVVALSAKTGEGVSELLDIILLVAGLENLTGDVGVPAEGSIIDSELYPKSGIAATCIIQNGTMRKGMYIASDNALSPLRNIQDWKGTSIIEASFSSPVHIVGWNVLPTVGSDFKTFETKKEAEKYAAEVEVKSQKSKVKDKNEENKNKEIKKFPIVIKADTSGSLEAIIFQVRKLGKEKFNDTILPLVVHSGIGTISESDIRMALGREHAYLIGFNVKVDSQAKALAERDHVDIVNFTVIYALSEWLEQKLTDNIPRIEVEEMTGESKVLKTFSKVKDKQIIGCRMESGKIMIGEQVKIIRRDTEITVGKVRELQTQKMKVSEVEEGKEFGAMIEAKIEIAPGDKLRAITMVTK